MHDLDRTGDDSSVNGFTGECESASALLPRRKIPPKLYRVSEVAAYGGVTRQTIHNYTLMGLLREGGWTRGGHRLYDESVFARLDSIEALKQMNLSMQAIREHFAKSMP